MPFCESCHDCLSYISTFSIPVRFDNLAVRPYVGKSGQRRQKSDSTGLPVKGNKRRAQQMLDNRLKELAQQYAPPWMISACCFWTSCGTGWTM
jgi:hypothetical protein